MAETPHTITTPPLNWPPSLPARAKELIAIHNTIHRSGQPNSTGCRIPLPTHLNISRWRDLLGSSTYDDKVVLDYLEFGWPINYTLDTLPNIPPTNHGSAHKYASDVDEFITKEINLGGTLGPFTTNPFPTQLYLSPLQTVQKDPTGTQGARRVVLDLSYPPGTSINDGIPKDTFMDNPYTLQYPSVDSLAQLVRIKGPGSLMYKRDLSRAYRQLNTCPQGWSKTAYSWRGLTFVDIVEVFGLRSAALACQRTTNSVRFIFNSQGYHCVNYLDDFGGVDNPSEAKTAFDALGLLLQDLNLKENLDKACPPNTNMVFLGIYLDSIKMTLSLPNDKLNRLKSLLQVWLGKRTTNKRGLQSLLGSLNHACSCIRPGRTFLNRMLEALRSWPPNCDYIALSGEFKKDINWWSCFIQQHNGVSMMAELHWSQPDGVFATDATLQACGGFYEGKYFHTSFPPALQGRSINALELITITVAAKLWAHHWRGKRIVVLCDNLCSVDVVRFSRPRDPFLQACCRELRYLEAKFSFDINAKHISGVDNRIPDYLSRWDESDYNKKQFNLLTNGYTLTQFNVPQSMFNFSHQW